LSVLFNDTASRQNHTVCDGSVNQYGTLAELHCQNHIKKVQVLGELKFS